MLEALWSVEFSSNAGGARPNVGAGMVVLENGRVLGGDPWFTIIAAYTAPQGGNAVESEVEVKRYRPDPHVQSIFGAGFDHVRLKLSGVPDRNGFTMTGQVIGKPEIQVRVQLVRRAELP